MPRIVTTHYRYKRPPRKRKAVASEAPAVVRKAKPSNDNRPEAELLPNPEKKPAIVSARRPGKRSADVPDLTPEEHQRRANTADALWRELVRRATAK
jgi:hypothetical protein